MVEVDYLFIIDLMFNLYFMCDNFVIMGYGIFLNYMYLVI